MDRKIGAILITIVLSLILMISGETLFAKNTNLIKNPGFEAAKNNFPRDWKLKNESLPPGVTVEISKDNPHSGAQCLMFNHGEPCDSLVIQNLKVKKDHVYMITCWIRTENVAQQAGSANLTLYYGDISGNVEGILTSQEFSDTGNQWIKLEFPFRARKTSTPLIFGLRFGGQGVTNQGKVYFDDVEVKEIPSRDDAIGFYIPGGEEPSSEPPSGFPNPFAKVNLFVVIGTLVVGLLVFLEFQLSRKEKKEQAEAQKTEVQKENSAVNQADGAPDAQEISPDSENKSFPG